MARTRFKGRIGIWQVTSNYTEDRFFQSEADAHTWISEETDHAQETHNGFTPDFNITPLLVWTNPEAESLPQVQS